MLYNVITDWVDLKKLFEDDDRINHLSSCGYQFILDWYFYEDKEVDAPDLDEKFEEYGNNCFYSFQDFIDDYGCYYPLDEYLNDNNLNKEEYHIDDYIEDLVYSVDKYAHDLSSCELLKNGNVMIVR